jgi:HEAT repeat protein
VAIALATLLVLGLATTPALAAEPDIAQLYEGRTLSEWGQDLNDLSPNVRREAVRALAHFGPAALPFLMRAARDNGPGVQTEVATVVSRMGPVAVPALVDALGEPDTAMQHFAITTLSAMGPEAKDAVPALLQTLGSPTGR